VNHERQAAGHQLLQLRAKPNDRFRVLEIDATNSQIIRGSDWDARRFYCRRQWPLAREELAKEVALRVQPLRLFVGLPGGDVCKP
jgi:hypothetical protein